MVIEYFFHNMSDKKDFFIKERGSHLYNVLFLVKAGGFVCSIDGRTFTAGAGDAVLFKANEYFRRRVTSSLAYLQAGFFVKEGGEIFDGLASGVLPLDKDYTGLLERDIRRAATCRQASAFISELICDALMRSTINLYCSESTRCSDGDVEKCKQYFYEHLSEKISLSALAKSLGLTHNGLIWKFRRYEHIAPNEYLRTLRLETGKNLLASTSLRINEIAALCGFSSAYYFSAAFRQKYSLPPSVWRKLSGKSLQR